MFGLRSVTTYLKTQFVIGTVYGHPQQKCQTFEAAFKINLKHSKAYKKRVVVGDFDIDYNWYDTIVNVKKYQYTDKITCLECKQMVDSPTRISLIGNQS